MLIRSYIIGYNFFLSRGSHNQQEAMSKRSPRKKVERDLSPIRRPKLHSSLTVGRVFLSIVDASGEFTNYVLPGSALFDGALEALWHFRRKGLIDTRDEIIDSSPDKSAMLRVLRSLNILDDSSSVHINEWKKYRKPPGTVMGEGFLEDKDKISYVFVIPSFD